VAVFSPLLNGYTAETLLGIGRGAWACNDSAADEQVAVVDECEVLAVHWPTCCGPAPYAGAGNALLVFQNDSPYPLTFAAPPVDDQGNQVDNGILVHGLLRECGTCGEYAPDTHTRCAAGAETRSVVVPPGRYLLHIQSEGADVPDLQGVIDLQSNTSYALCFFATNDRRR
jgi:hypothetical protein